MRHHLPQSYLHEFSKHGTPVILVGDILGGSASWNFLSESLGQELRVIGVSPMLVAYSGQGQLPPEPWSIKFEAEALATAMDNLGIPSAHIGGWSLGGAIAAAFAVHYPHRTKTLMLIEPQMRWVLRELGKHLEADDGAEKFRGYGHEISQKELADFLHEVGAVPFNEDPIQSRAWRLAWVHRLAIRYAHKVIDETGDLSSLRKLDMPTLLVRGNLSLDSDIGITDALAKLIPKACMQILEGNHTSHFANPDAFMNEYIKLINSAIEN
ncbi:MAG: hypothetical protein CL776_05630 [Chloroflexi bacterium]|nr:hypothetical protein [Chloroflexota bacterium]|tara:strand:- start:6 stop:809 length:804 start_codon:yes stop_codon:yes gene_type:complete